LQISLFLAIFAPAFMPLVGIRCEHVAERERKVV